MDAREWLLFVEMLVNAVIAVCWAVGATLAAQGERVRQRPVPWRWVVAFWMIGKAALFSLIVAAFFWAIGFPLAEAVVGGFTVAHAWAFARWLRLPAERERRGHR